MTCIFTADRAGGLADILMIDAASFANQLSYASFLINSISEAHGLEYTACLFDEQ